MTAMYSGRPKSLGLLSALAALTLTCTASLSACGDDNDDNVTHPGDGDGDGDNNGDGDNGDGDTSQPGERPLYAITTQVASGDTGQWISKIILADTLTASKATKLNLNDGISVNGRALSMTPGTNEGVLYVASDDGPTITEFTLDAGDKLKAGRTVNFEARGISKFTEYSGLFPFASAEKAYVFDGATAQIVVWHPKEMKLGRGISLSELNIDKQLLSFSNDPIVVDNQIIQFAGWREGLFVYSMAGVVVLDTETDVATVVKDDRCGYVRNGVLGEDGKIYMATEAFGSAAHYVNDVKSPKPCLLRFDLATKRFDSNFHVDLNALFGGKASGTILAGPDGKAYVKVLDSSLIPDNHSGKDHPRVLASLGVWKWGTLTLGDEPTGKSIPGDATLGSVMPFHFGNVTYAPLFWNNERTTFLPITEDGPGKANLEVSGVVFSIAKLR